MNKDQVTKWYEKQVAWVTKAHDERKITDEQYEKQLAGAAKYYEKVTGEKPVQGGGE